MKPKGTPRKLHTRYIARDLTVYEEQLDLLAVEIQERDQVDAKRRGSIMISVSFAKSLLKNLHLLKQQKEDMESENERLRNELYRLQANIK